MASLKLCRLARSRNRRRHNRGQAMFVDVVSFCGLLPNFAWFRLSLSFHFFFFATPRTFSQWFYRLLRAPDFLGRISNLFVFTRFWYVIGGYARKINAEKCILHLLHDPTFFALYPTRPESSFGALQRECKKNICCSRIYHLLLTRITLLHNTRHCFFGEFWT